LAGADGRDGTDIIPLIAIFFLAQDFFIKGVTLSALKGE
jgi:ABC-type maltose transport system permease subunit